MAKVSYPRALQGKWIVSVRTHAVPRMPCGTDTYTVSTKERTRRECILQSSSRASYEEPEHSCAGQGK